MKNIRCCDCGWLLMNPGRMCGPECDAPIPAWAKDETEDGEFLSPSFLVKVRSCDAYRPVKGEPHV